MSNKVHMLTTIDNPFDPISQFDEWYMYDLSHGYNSLSLLARIAPTSNTLSDAQNRLIIEEGIEEIVELNLSGMHTKIEVEIKDEDLGLTEELRVDDELNVDDDSSVNEEV